MDGFPAVARIYEIPTLDLRQLWPHYWEPQGTHPDFRTHELVAELVASVLFKSVHPQCSDYLDQDNVWYSDPDLLQKLPVCTVPLSKHSSYDHAATVPLNTSYSGP